MKGQAALYEGRACPPLKFFALAGIAPGLPLLERIRLGGGVVFVELVIFMHCCTILEHCCTSLEARDPGLEGCMAKLLGMGRWQRHASAGAESVWLRGYVCVGEEGKD